jgi:hypothetical protein
MTALPIRIKPTADDIIAMLDAAQDRAELVELLARLRLPEGADDFERAQVTAALIKAATRCWCRRTP